MTESVPSDTTAQIHALRSQGADRLDPVGLHYLEVLSRRTSTQQGPARRILEEKLALTMAAYTQQLEQRHSAARNAPDAPPNHPGPLGELVQYLAQHNPANGEAQTGVLPGARPELKAVRNFRGTWARLSAERQVAQALSQAPQNAGPINSHRVVLQSLALMRDIAPDYLNHFMTYVDTLLCLSDAQRPLQPGTRATTTGPSARKPKTSQRRQRSQGTI